MKKKIMIVILFFLIFSVPKISIDSRPCNPDIDYEPANRDFTSILENVVTSDYVYIGTIIEIGEPLCQMNYL